MPDRTVGRLAATVLAVVAFVACSTSRPLHPTPALTTSKARSRSPSQSSASMTWSFRGTQLPA